MQSIRPSRFCIVPNVLLRDSFDDSKLLRVIAIDIDQIWLIGVYDNDWPYPLPIETFFAEFESDASRYTIEYDDPYKSRLVVTDQRPKTKNVQEERWNVIAPLISNENERAILFRRHRKRLISAILADANCSRQHITNILKLYWKRGMTYHALAPMYDNCGGKGKPRAISNAPGSAKLGAPRTNTPGKGINADEATKRALLVGATYWLSPQKPSLKRAWDHLTGLFYSVPQLDREGRKIGVTIDPEKQPTQRQLQYFIETNFPRNHRILKRGGQKNYDLQERAITGRGDQGTMGPGDQFQVDATVADVYLVSQFDRRRIVGRPVLYFVIDVWSRLIVGLYIGFEGPSWIGAMMALTNMVAPKVDFCAQYGIEIEEADWPAHDAPRTILADRGELMSVQLGGDITRYLKIEIENAAPYRGDLKAIVERRFGIVPALFKPFTPGYVQQDFGERGARDYRLDAKLNLNEFTAMAIYAVLIHNISEIEKKDLPPEMVTDGLIASPINLWNWGIKFRSGALRRLNIDEVSLAVMPRAQARVTPKGIRFKGEFYSCPTALRQDWFATARRNEWNVEISYDPRALQQFYIRDKALPQGFEVCRMFHDDSTRRNISLYEVEKLEAAKKSNSAQAQNSSQGKRVFYDQKMEDLRNNAERATDAVTDKNVSNAERVKDIRSNRADEKFVQRGSEAFVLGGNTGREPASADKTVGGLTDQHTTANLALLRKQRENHLAGKRSSSGSSHDN